MINSNPADPVTSSNETSIKNNPSPLHAPPDVSRLNENELSGFISVEPSTTRLELPSVTT